MDWFSSYFEYDMLCVSNGGKQDESDLTLSPVIG